MQPAMPLYDETDVPDAGFMRRVGAGRSQRHDGNAKGDVAWRREWKRFTWEVFDAE
jgi:hypothetical protein